VALAGAEQKKPEVVIMRPKQTGKNGKAAGISALGEKICMEI